MSRRLVAMILALRVGHIDARCPHRGGTTLYATVEKPTGKPEANDYLVLAGAGVASYDVDALAYAVIRGEYGTGAARRNALGDRYETV